MPHKRCKRSCARYCTLSPLTLQSPTLRASRFTHALSPTQLSHSLVESGDKHKFTWALQRLTTMLDGGPAWKGSIAPPGTNHSPATDVKLAIRGCGVFAPAVRQVMGIDGVKRLLTHLLVASARMLDEASGGGATLFGTEQRRVYQKAECLNAFATLVCQVWSLHPAMPAPSTLVLPPTTQLTHAPPLPPHSCQLMNWM